MAKVDHIERVEREQTNGAGMFFIALAAHWSDREVDLANAELGRRGVKTRLVRATDFTIR